jgi:hypothetical protein
MKNKKPHFLAFAVMATFFLMALASAPPRRVVHTKPVIYPCVRHAALTYSPILLKLNISSNYTMKDLPGVRQMDPTMIMEALHSLNYSYKLADGVTPNLVLNITYTNDGYDHYGVNLNVNWQGEGNFTITLQPNYVTVSQLINDMAKELNVWVTQGWHEGTCN